MTMISCFLLFAIFTTSSTTSNGDPSIRENSLSFVISKASADLKCREQDVSDLKQQQSKLISSIDSLRNEIQKIASRREKFEKNAARVEAEIDQLTNALISNRKGMQEKLQKDWIAQTGTDIPVPELDMRYVSKIGYHADPGLDLALPQSLRSAQEIISNTTPSTDVSLKLNHYSRKITNFVEFRIEDRHQRQEIDYHIDRLDNCQHEIWESQANALIHTSEMNVAHLQLQAVQIKLSVYEQEIDDLRSFIDRCQQQVL